jgi:hypothetical protein
MVPPPHYLNNFRIGVTILFVLWVYYFYLYSEDVPMEDLVWWLTLFVGISVVGLTVVGVVSVPSFSLGSAKPKPLESEKSNAEEL